jgi:hypothetical protein
MVRRFVSRGLPRGLGLCLLMSWVVSSAAAQAPEPSAAQVPAQPPTPAAPSPEATATQVDRVVAVVDEDPVLASDLERVIRLKLVAPQAGEGEQAFRRRVLEQLIDDRLRFHEIDRFGFQQVPVEDIERQVDEIRSRFASREEFERELAALDLDLESLRQLVARQLLVLDYVEERLGARVFVTPEDVRTYYETVLAPEAAGHGQAAPPLDEVRDQIYRLLREQRLNQEIDLWTEELRAQADIVNSFDREDRPLPPVVHRILSPGAPPAPPG